MPDLLYRILPFWVRSSRDFVAQFLDIVPGDPAERFFGYLCVIKGNCNHAVFHVNGVNPVHFPYESPQGKGTFLAKTLFYTDGNLFHNLLPPRRTFNYDAGQNRLWFLQYITKKTVGKIIFPSQCAENI